MAGIIPYETGDIVEMKKSIHAGVANGRFSKRVQILK